MTGEAELTVHDGYVLVSVKGDPLSSEEIELRLLKVTEQAKEAGVGDPPIVGSDHEHDRRQPAGPPSVPRTHFRDGIHLPVENRLCVIVTASPPPFDEVVSRPTSLLGGRLHDDTSNTDSSAPESAKWLGGCGF
jgi:hypothetical protein